MGKVQRLVTKREQEERAALDRAASALRDLPKDVLEQLPARHRAAISDAERALTRHARSREGIWPGGYVMLSRVQAKWVWDRIRALPPHKRPIQVRDAFMFVLLNLDHDTGEVMLSRYELAEEIGCAPQSVSAIMGTLEELGVVERQRRPEPGYRGRGRVVYVVVAHTAWNGKLEFRTRAAAKQQAPSERVAPDKSAKGKRPNLKVVQPREAAE